MKISAVAAERRPTLHFLREIRAISPVFLDTDVDMTAVVRHRETQHKYSVVSYVLHSAARVLAAHPEANAALHGRLRPRVARYASVNGKFTLDRTLNGQRIVLSTVLTDLQRASLDEIQQRVEHFRDGDPASMPEFAGARLLQRLPGPVGSLLFRMGTRPLNRRADVMGTFAVTSLGHRPVDGFHSVGGTTITLGVGRIADRPVARGTEVAVAPLMRLSLTFDHRVIDGAEAADVLTDLKQALETFPAADDTDAAGTDAAATAAATAGTGERS
ncbi:2-oxo acid dehydrogenase subunit E2 [Kitasatospora sp. NBC_01560]|uniref:2-oxo acid dehydrogenase subunit E2 n=1 Tax=Kitasatospora sp. NBC_01560 TaxID=2975965 RepID=UPI003866EE55